MSAGSAVQVVGIVLQAIGLSFAAYGIWQTFRAFAPEGEGFWGWLGSPIAERGRRIGQWTALRWRQLLRRPQHHVIGVGAAIGLVGALNARVRVGFGPLDLSQQEAALRELERRVSQLSDRIAEVDEHWADETDSLRGQVAALETRIDTAIAELKSRDQTVAVGGLRPAVFGLFLNGLGLLLIAAGLILEGLNQ
jgi:hypothetical protein